MLPGLKSELMLAEAGVGFNAGGMSSAEAASMHAMTVRIERLAAGRFGTLFLVFSHVSTRD